jgi:hypothetical protein
MQLVYATYELMQLYATYECVTYILLMQLMNATISS